MVKGAYDMFPDILIAHDLMQERREHIAIVSYNGNSQSSPRKQFI